jgi:hypothetical protein
MEINNMTKKDYIKFAKMIAEEKERIVRDEPMLDTRELLTDELLTVSHKIARLFADDNSRFDRSRFLRACGLE